MKHLFLVSSLNKGNLDKYQNIYLADPYLNDVFPPQFKSRIILSCYNRKIKADLLNHQKYIDDKCDIYTQQIAELLNRYHCKEYGAVYWAKCFNLNFRRFITLAHDAYLTFAKFDRIRHSANKLGEESYYVPLDFGDATNFIKGSEFATEQLFSVYLSVFYPNEPYDPLYAEYKITSEKATVYTKIVSLRAKFKRAFEKNLLTEILKVVLSRRQPKVGIIHSFFSYQRMNELFAKSFGLIQCIPLNLNYRSINKIDRGCRIDIFNDFVVVDDFDRYMLRVFQKMLPRLYVEEYLHIEEKTISIASRFPKLEYIFCEAFQSNDYLSLFLAVCKEKGIKHFYNEHNFISHVYCGNNVQRLAEMCDSYLTLGWNDRSYPNTEKSASLFPFRVHVPYPIRFYIWGIFCQ